MTAGSFARYLEITSDIYKIEDRPILIGGKPIVNARVIAGQLHLETFEDYLTYQAGVK